MKGERRHELQHNELADYITGIVSTVKPYFNAILGSVLLVLVAALSYFWWSGRSVEQEQAGWNEFLVQRGKADFQLFDLDEFGERHKDTEVSFRVHAFSGDMQLIQGCQNLFVNKAAARDELGQAKEHYTAVRDECDDPVLLLRATFGLARVHEALGAVDQAVERYEEVVQNKEWSGTACASQAKKRLESLAQADNKWFYDQFAEYDPTPKTNPIDPGMLPFDPSSLGEPSGSGDGSGGSSLLDLPLLDGGTSQPDDTSLLPTFGGTGTTEPDGTPDAGTPDAGTPDAGTPDAATPDGGTPDATTPDAGTPDAGTPDAGTPDAGTPDAGTPDAGTPDAGTPDAGTPDAGTPDPGTAEPVAPDMTEPADSGADSPPPTTP